MPNPAHLLRAAIIPVLALLFAPATHAQTNDEVITYQGQLESDGQPITAPTQVFFRLYTQATGGSHIGEELTVVQPDDAGVFTAFLRFDPVSADPPIFFNGESRWIEIQVGTETLEPRQPITASPVALATRGLFVTPDGKVKLGEGYDRVDIADGVNLKLDSGNLLLPNGGICLDTDGNCSAVPGGIRVGEGGVLGSNVTNNNVLIQPNGDGLVGIGTATPELALHVRGDGIRFENDNGGIDLSNNSDRAAMQSIGQDFHLFAEGNKNVLLQPGGSGRVGIGVVSPTEMLDVGGAIRLRGADIVEGFNASSGGVIEAGTLVVIDDTPGQEGNLKPSDGAYDTKVAGIVSGAGGIPYGMNMGVDGVLDGETKVAMAGRVYVQCSTENGPIRPGDLLTTADLPGHAMRATDRDRSHGAVVGKAMSSLDEETGLVLVLVNLQ